MAGIARLHKTTLGMATHKKEESAKQNGEEVPLSLPRDENHHGSSQLDTQKDNSNEMLSWAGLKLLKSEHNTKSALGRNIWHLYKDRSHSKPRANSTPGFLFRSLKKILPIKNLKTKWTLQWWDQFKGHHLAETMNSPAQKKLPQTFFHLLF